MPKAELSIIIVSYNVREYLLKCIASVMEQTKEINYEIVVVDNVSADGSIDAVERVYPEVITVRNTENVGFAKANNQGFAKSSGEFVLLLNPDTEVKPGSIEEVLSFMKKEPTAGIASCRMIGSDGLLQKSIHPFTNVWRNIAWTLFIDRLFFREHRTGYYYQEKPFKVDSIGGAFMMVRRAALGDGPLLNPDYFMYSEEKDLSLRLHRSGWHTYFVPTAEIIHYGGRSTSLMPVAMFREVQKSQVKFFLNFYSRGYAFALCLSWWLVLCSQTIASIPLTFLRSGRNRFNLFAKATVAFPGYVAAAFANKK